MALNLGKVNFSVEMNYKQLMAQLDNLEKKLAKSLSAGSNLQLNFDWQAIQRFRQEITKLKTAEGSVQSFILSLKSMITEVSKFDSSLTFEFSNFLKILKDVDTQIKNIVVGMKSIKPIPSAGVVPTSTSKVAPTSTSKVAPTSTSKVAPTSTSPVNLTGALNKPIKAATGMNLDSLTSGLSKAGAVGFAIAGAIKLATELVEQISKGIDVLNQFNYGVAKTLSILDEGQRAKFGDDFLNGLRDLRVQTGETIESLTKGLYDLISSGVPAEDSMKALEIASKGAVAGVTTTAKTIDMLTTAYNSFTQGGEKMYDFEQIMDIVFQTTKLGKITVDEMSGALGRVTSVANTAGISMEEIGAAVSVLTLKGQSARLSMTGILAMIRKFSNPKIAESLKMIGVEVQEADGTLRNLGDIMGELGKQKLNIGQMIELGFDEPTRRAVASLMEDTKSVTGETVNVMQDMLTKFDPSVLAGATDDAYNVVAGSTQKTLERLSASWESVMTNTAEGIRETFYGSKFLGALSSALSWIDEMTAGHDRLAFRAGADKKAHEDLAISLTNANARLQILSESVQTEIALKTQSATEGEKQAIVQKVLNFHQAKFDNILKEVNKTSPTSANHIKMLGIESLTTAERTKLLSNSLETLTGIEKAMAQLKGHEQLAELGKTMKDLYSKQIGADSFLNRFFGKSIHEAAKNADSLSAAMQNINNPAFVAYAEKMLGIKVNNKNLTDQELSLVQQVYNLQKESDIVTEKLSRGQISQVKAGQELKTINDELLTKKSLLFQNEQALNKATQLVKDNVSETMDIQTLALTYSNGDLDLKEAILSRLKEQGTQVSDNANKTKEQLSLEYQKSEEYKRALGFKELEGVKTEDILKINRDVNQENQFGNKSEKTKIGLLLQSLTLRKQELQTLIDTGKVQAKDVKTQMDALAEAEVKLQGKLKKSAEPKKVEYDKESIKVIEDYKKKQQEERFNKEVESNKKAVKDQLDDKKKSIEEEFNANKEALDKETEAKKQANEQNKQIAKTFKEEQDKAIQENLVGIGKEIYAIDEKYKLQADKLKELGYSEEQLISKRVALEKKANQEKIRMIDEEYKKLEDKNKQTFETMVEDARNSLAEPSTELGKGLDLVKEKLLTMSEEYLKLNQEKTTGEVVTEGLGGKQAEVKDDAFFKEEEKKFIAYQKKQEEDLKKQKEKQIKDAETVANEKIKQIEEVVKKYKDSQEKQKLATAQKILSTQEALGRADDLAVKRAPEITQQIKDIQGTDAGSLDKKAKLENELKQLTTDRENLKAGLGKLMSERDNLTVQSQLQKDSYDKSLKQLKQLKDLNLTEKADETFNILDSEITELNNSVQKFAEGLNNNLEKMKKFSSYVESEATTIKDDPDMMGNSFEGIDPNKQPATKEVKNINPFGSYSTGGDVPTKTKKYDVQYLATGGFAKGTDTQPAMLTEGEYVLNTKEVAMLDKGGFIGANLSKVMADFSTQLLNTADGTQKQYLNEIMQAMSTFDPSKSLGSLTSSMSEEAGQYFNTVVKSYQDNLIANADKIYISKTGDTVTELKTTLNKMNESDDKAMKETYKQLFSTISTGYNSLNKLTTNNNLNEIVTRFLNVAPEKLEENLKIVTQISETLTLNLEKDIRGLTQGFDDYKTSYEKNLTNLGNSFYNNAKSFREQMILADEAMEKTKSERSKLDGLVIETTGVESKKELHDKSVKDLKKIQDIEKELVKKSEEAKQKYSEYTAAMGKKRMHEQFELQKKILKDELTSIDNISQSESFDILHESFARQSVDYENLLKQKKINLDMLETERAFETDADRQVELDSMIEKAKIQKGMLSVQNDLQRGYSKGLKDKEYENEILKTRLASLQEIKKDTFDPASLSLINEEVKKIQLQILQSQKTNFKSFVSFATSIVDDAIIETDQKFSEFDKFKEKTIAKIKITQELVSVETSEKMDDATKIYEKDAKNDDLREKIKSKVDLLIFAEINKKKYEGDENWERNEELLKETEERIKTLEKDIIELIGQQKEIQSEIAFNLASTSEEVQGHLRNIKNWESEILEKDIYANTFKQLREETKFLDTTLSKLTNISVDFTKKTISLDKTMKEVLGKPIPLTPDEIDERIKGINTRSSVFEIDDKSVENRSQNQIQIAFFDELKKLERFSSEDIKTLLAYAQKNSSLEEFASILAKDSKNVSIEDLKNINKQRDIEIKSIPKKIEKIDDDIYWKIGKNPNYKEEERKKYEADKKKLQEERDSMSFITTKAGLSLLENRWHDAAKSNLNPNLNPDLNPNIKRDIEKGRIELLKTASALNISVKPIQDAFDAFDKGEIDLTDLYKIKALLIDIIEEMQEVQKMQVYIFAGENITQNLNNISDSIKGLKQSFNNFENNASSFASSLGSVGDIVKSVSNAAKDLWEGFSDVAAVIPVYGQAIAGAMKIGQALVVLGDELFGGESKQEEIERLKKDSETRIAIYENEIDWLKQKRDWNQEYSQKAVEYNIVAEKSYGDRIYTQKSLNDELAESQKKLKVLNSPDTNKSSAELESYLNKAKNSSDSLAQQRENFFNLEKKANEQIKFYETKKTSGIALSEKEDKSLLEIKDTLDISLRSQENITKALETQVNTLKEQLDLRTQMKELEDNPFYSVDDILRDNERIKESIKNALGTGFEQKDINVMSTLRMLVPSFEETVDNPKTELAKDKIDELDTVKVLSLKEISKIKDEINELDVAKFSSLEKIFEIEDETIRNLYIEAYKNNKKLAEAKKEDAFKYHDLKLKQQTAENKLNKQSKGNEKELNEQSISAEIKGQGYVIDEINNKIQTQKTYMKESNLTGELKIEAGIKSDELQLELKQAYEDMEKLKIKRYTDYISFEQKNFDKTQKNFDKTQKTKLENLEKEQKFLKNNQEYLQTVPDIYKETEEVQLLIFENLQRQKEINQEIMQETLSGIKSNLELDLKNMELKKGRKLEEQEIQEITKESLLLQKEQLVFSFEKTKDLEYIKEINQQILDINLQMQEYDLQNIETIKQRYDSLESFADANLQYSIKFEQARNQQIFDESQINLYTESTLKYKKMLYQNTLTMLEIEKNLYIGTEKEYEITNKILDIKNKILDADIEIRKIQLGLSSEYWNKQLKYYSEELDAYQKKTELARGFKYSEQERLTLEQHFLYYQEDALLNIINTLRIQEQSIEQQEMLIEKEKELFEIKYKRAELEKSLLDQFKEKISMADQELQNEILWSQFFEKRKLSDAEIERKNLLYLQTKFDYINKIILEMEKEGYKEQEILEYRNQYLELEQEILRYTKTTEQIKNDEISLIEKRNEIAVQELKLANKNIDISKQEADLNKTNKDEQLRILYELLAFQISIADYELNILDTKSRINGLLLEQLDTQKELNKEGTINNKKLAEAYKTLEKNKALMKQGIITSLQPATETFMTAGKQAGLNEEQLQTTAKILNIPAFATGGFVDYTGLALVHKNEYIVPSNQVKNLSMKSNSINAPINIIMNNVSNGQQVLNMLQRKMPSLLDKTLKNFGNRGLKSIL